MIFSATVPAHPTRRAGLILALGGCNLVLIQWIMIRELTALLMGTELVALFVTGSAFLGYSVGYWLSSRLSDRVLRIVAVITLPLHLALPVLYRLIIGSLGQLAIYRVGFVLLLAITPFAVTTFYSLFLPRFINARGNLIVLYSIELAGSAVGFILLPIISAVGGYNLLALTIPYTLILIVLLSLVNVRRWTVAALAVAGIAWLAVLPAVDSASNAYVYRTVHDLPGAQSLASTYSPYQKVDVIRDQDGTLYLYLNGLMDYGSSDLARFNVLLTGVPAQMIRPPQMAIVGSGSMASVALASPYTQHLTTVEIDPVVADLSRRYFTDINRLDQARNWTLIIDDAKHYFGGTTDRYDLISMDVPAPFTIQEGTLHSAEFYALLKRHLTPRGVVSVSLSNIFGPTHELPRRVVAGLLANFSQVVVVTSQSADLSFAYAGDDLPFDSAALESVLHANSESGYAIYQTDAARYIVADAKPISLDDMRLVWTVSLSRVRHLLEAN